MVLSMIAGATVAATKWLLAAKIMTAVGTGYLTVAPAVEKLRAKKRSG